jgi:hypothetical protein
VPVYYIRYEDQTTKTEEILTELFQFLLNQPTLAGTLLEQKIKHAKNAGHESMKTY